MRSDVDIGVVVSAALTACLYFDDASSGSVQLCRCLSSLHGWELCNPIDTHWEMWLRGRNMG